MRGYLFDGDFAVLDSVDAGADNAVRAVADLLVALVAVIDDELRA